MVGNSLLGWDKIRQVSNITDTKIAAQAASVATVIGPTRIKYPQGIVYDTLAGVSVAGTGLTYAIDTTHGLTLKLTTDTSNHVGEIERNPSGLYSANGEFALKFYIEDYTKVSTITVYLSKDTSYTNFALFSYNVAGYTELQRNGWHQWHFGDSSPTAGSEKSFTGSAFTTAGIAIQRMKIRITPASGQAAVAYFKYLASNPQQPKATFIITADDGYASWQSLGIPYLDGYGIKSTNYIIGASIGTGTGDAAFYTLAQAQAMYANGHDISVHGAASLAGLADPGAVLADIQTNQSYLVANGMPRGQYQYAWPNGVFEKSTESMSLKDAVVGQGIVTARGTQRQGLNVSGIPFYQSLPFESHDVASYGPDLLNTTIIGHDGTADVGASQLAALQARITRINATKSTAILMFHKIGSTVDALHCPQADFNAIIDAIAGYVAAGTAETLTMSQLYNRLVTTEKQFK